MSAIAPYRSLRLHRIRVLTNRVGGRYPRRPLHRLEVLSIRFRLTRRGLTEGKDFEIERKCGGYWSRPLLHGL